MIVSPNVFYCRVAVRSFLVGRFIRVLRAGFCVPKLLSSAPLSHLRISAPAATQSDISAHTRSLFRTLALRSNTRAAISRGPQMFSPVPSPEGTKETYWETKAPSSDVLGIGAGVSSGNFAAASVFAALVGGYCTGQ
eukprot:393424-Rhodomonas_salina.2